MIHSSRAFCSLLTWSGLLAIPTSAIISKNSSSPASHSWLTSSPPTTSSSSRPSSMTTQLQQQQQHYQFIVIHSQPTNTHWTETATCTTGLSPRSRWLASTVYILIVKTVHLYIRSGHIERHLATVLIWDKSNSLSTTDLFPSIQINLWVILLKHRKKRREKPMDH